MVKVQCKYTQNRKTGKPYKTYVVTIPNAIVNALDLEGKHLNVKLQGTHIVLVPLVESEAID